MWPCDPHLSFFFSHPFQVTSKQPRNMLSGPVSVASMPSSSCVSTSSSMPTLPDTALGKKVGALRTLRSPLLSLMKTLRPRDG